MSELDLHGLPPLPPARPMTDEDWERLHANVFGTIGAYERRRRTRTLLIAAAVLVVALIAIAAAWELTRPSANSRTDVTVLCASEPVALGGGAVVTLDGLDPVTRCRQEWEGGFVKAGQTAAPALVACARGTYEESVYVTVFPALPGNTCAALDYDPVPPRYTEQALRFARVADALAPLTDAPGHCVTFGAARDAAQQALGDAGLEGWEVVRDGSYDGDDSCFITWLFDYDQQLLYLFGMSRPGPASDPARTEGRRTGPS